MKREKSNESGLLPKPSEGELRILHVLWENGPSTVRQVFEKLATTPAVGYTTVLKLMQIMFEKHLVHRDETARSHVYAANLRREEAEERFLDDLLETVFEGSKKRLVMQILSDAKASKEELDEIRKIIISGE